MTMTLANKIMLEIKTLGYENAYSFSLDRKFCNIKLSNILNNKTKNPNLKTLHELAKALDLQLYELLENVDLEKTIYGDRNEATRKRYSR